MIKSQDIKKGTCIRMDGKLYFCIDFLHVKPGKGNTIMRTTLKDVVSGRVLEKRFNIGEALEDVRVERRPYQYLYQEGEDFIFMNQETFDQIPIAKDLITGVDFMKESDVVEVPFYKMEGTRAVKTVSKRFVYGDEFLEKMLDEYATLAEPRIETLLREQGENSYFSYSSSSGGVESLGSMTLFILLITVCIPLGMALYYILQKKKAVCQ